MSARVAGSPRGSSPRPRILIIEDDDDLRGMIEEVLNAAGYGVAVATNGAHGLEVYARAPADLVITDLFMPEMDGFETIGELRGDPAVRLIAMSGGSRRLDQERYLEMARQLGVTHVLRKPFAASALLAAVTAALASS